MNMTQKQLDARYKRVTRAKDYDKAYDKYCEDIRCRGGTSIVCDWKHYGDVVKDFIAVLENYDHTVLIDPAYKGSDTYAWYIFQDEPTF